MNARLSSLICFILMLCSGCSSQDYSYHLRFWEWYFLNADRALSRRDFSRAEKLFQDALKETENFGSTDFHQIVSLNRLAELYELEGKHKDAEPLYKRSLAALDKRGAAIKSETIELKHQRCQGLLGLADIWEGQGKHAQAETLYRRALAIEEPIWKESNSRAQHILIGQDFARTLCGLTRVCRNTGSFEQAEKFCKRALATAAVAVIPDTLTEQIVGEYALLLKATHPEANLDLSALDLLSALAQPDLKFESSANNNLWEQHYLTAKRLAANKKWAAAKSNFVLALEQANSFSAQDPRLASTLDGLARALFQQKDQARAEGLYLKALALRRGSPNRSDIDLALSLQHIAALYFYQDKRRQSKPYYEQELLILSKQYGPDDLVMTEPAHRLANIYFGEGDNARAKAIYQKQLEIQEHRVGPDDHEILELLRMLARICLREKRYADAESLCKRLISVQEKAGKTESADFAFDLELAAAAYSQTGQYAQSEECLKRVSSVRKKLNGQDSPQLARGLTELATAPWQLLLDRAGQADGRGVHELAGKLYLEAIQRARQFSDAVDPQHQLLAQTLQAAVGNFRSRNRHSDAGDLLKEYCPLIREKFGPDSREYAAALFDLGIALLNVPRYPEAEKNFCQAISIQRKVLSANDPALATSYWALAEAYRLDNKISQAKPLYYKLLAIREKVLPATSREIADVVTRIAFICLMEQKMDKAEQLYKRALAIHKKALPDSESVAGDYWSVGEVCRLEGKFKEAVSFYTQALLLKQKLTPNDPLIKDIMSRLNEAREKAGHSGNTNTIKS